ncbi:MAG: DUF4234 domain-containing protein [Butyrivibrio sp.]
MEGEKMDNQNGNYNQGYNPQGNGQNYNQPNGQGYNGQNYNQPNGQGYNGQNYNQGYQQNGYNQNYNQGYQQNGYNQNYNQGYQQNGYNQGFNGNPENSYTGPVPPEFRIEKSVAACVILSIVTCGIYTFFWMWNVVKKIRMVTGQTDDCVGEYLLLMLVPYYNVYWVYTRGKKLYENAAFRGVQISDNSTLYLVLNILGLQIVSYAMIQDQLNSLARRV